MTSTEGGQSFTSRIADALQLHGPNRREKEILGVDRIIWRLDRVSG